MKKTFTILFLTISFLSFSQKVYKEISEKNINKERLITAKNFAKDYLDKCERKDYSSFQNYIIDSRAKMKLNDSIKQNCDRMELKYGKTEVLDFNSAYYNQYTKDFDPLDLFIFNFKAEKNTDVKYASVWVYKDKNVIGGLLFSKEKPLKKKSAGKK